MTEDSILTIFLKGILQQEGLSGLYQRTLAQEKEMFFQDGLLVRPIYNKNLKMELVKLLL